MKTICYPLFLSLCLLMAGCETDGYYDDRGGTPGGGSGGGGGGTGGFEYIDLPEGILTLEVYPATKGDLQCRVRLDGATGSTIATIGLFYRTETAFPAAVREGKWKSLSYRQEKAAYDFTVPAPEPDQQIGLQAYVAGRDMVYRMGEFIAFTFSEEWRAVPELQEAGISDEEQQVTFRAQIPPQVGNITERGFILASTGDMPDRLTPRIPLPDQAGVFEWTVDTLQRGLLYYVRAYIVSPHGLRFSEPLEFRTEAPELRAQVETLERQEAVANRLTAYGRITDPGGGEIEDCGFQWAVIPENFEVRGYTSSRNLDDEGYFSVTRSYDKPGTYYYRAYVRTRYGTVYGEIRSVGIEEFSHYLPVVTTNRNPTLGAGSIEAEGDVTADGGYPILERGFCYGTGSSPTTSNNKVTVSGRTGRMKATLTGFDAGKTYYFRAYARNAVGTVYGEPQRFSLRYSDYQTDFRDLSAMVNKDNSVTLKARIYNDRKQKIVEKGFCWTTSRYSEPTLSDQKEKAAGYAGASYEVKISSYHFSKGQTYRMRAYAVTEGGFVYYSDKYSIVEFTIPKD